MRKFGYEPFKADLNFYVNGGETQVGCTARESIQSFLGRIKKMKKFF